jgi:hypothetical protein
MIFTIQTTNKVSFSKVEIEELKAKYKSLKLILEETKIHPGRYFVLQDVNSIEELDALVEDFKCNIVYGGTGVVNDKTYPVIEIYDDYRE